MLQKNHKEETSTILVSEPYWFIQYKKSKVNQEQALKHCNEMNLRKEFKQRKQMNQRKELNSENEWV